MNETLLKKRLINDLKSIGVPVDFKLTFKPYSIRYNGRYNPNKIEVILYTYEDEECTKPRPYEGVLVTLLHEATHHYQWKHDSSFYRVKGVMHNSRFKSLEKMWLQKLNLKEAVSC